jgi:hypothetical protein
MAARGALRRLTSHFLNSNPHSVRPLVSLTSSACDHIGGHASTSGSTHGLGQGLSRGVATDAVGTGHSKPYIRQESVNRVIEAALTLVREQVFLKAETVKPLGEAEKVPALLGLPLGHNSSFQQGG